MSGILSVKTYAKELAYADVATRANQLKNQQAELDDESSALSDLDTALTDFQTAVDALDSTTSGPVVNSVTSSDDSITATADSTAMPGSYTFFVQQLAESQQTSIALPNGDSANPIPAEGTFTLTMGDSEMDIDLAQADADNSGTIDATEMANAINQSDENPGVTATLVKTGDTTTLMLTSDDTGAASAFTLASDNPALSGAIDQQKVQSTAQDAVIWLGNSPDTGTEITGSDNTFDDIIPGVSLTFTEVSETDKPVTFTVAQDSAGSQEQVQTFIDAYNTLADTLDSLTTQGGDGTASGTFAGDAGLASLQNQLDTLTHAKYGGVSIVDYGITLDKDGHLQLDSEQFDKEMAANPEGLTNIFVGDDSMTAQLDSVMETYLDSSNGIIAQRQAAITTQEDKISSQADQLKETYNSNYDRYVDEWTSTMVEITQMQLSMSAFE